MPSELKPPGERCLVSSDPDAATAIDLFAVDGFQLTTRLEGAKSCSPAP